MFADDSSLFHTFQGGKAEIDLNIMKENVDAITNWCNENKLTINTSKTKYMLFKNRYKKVHISGSITMNGNSIQEVDCTTFVGVHNR